MIESKTSPIHWALNHAVTAGTIPDTMSREDAIKAAFFLGAVAYDAAVETGAAVAARSEIAKFLAFEHAVSKELEQRYS